ncbi:hypothetical protein AB0K40_33710 [Nonomuraea bangladeshensis]|uniref:Uncharacterized protein n=1 Tax=Nonomuraea bangladeshensis TaxID=404385 RepID=A0ABV3HD72_9ACTN
MVDVALVVHVVGLGVDHHAFGQFAAEYQHLVERARALRIEVGDLQPLGDVVGQALARRDEQRPARMQRMIAIRAQEQVLAVKDLFVVHGANRLGVDDPCRRHLEIVRVPDGRQRDVDRLGGHDILPRWTCVTYAPRHDARIGAAPRLARSLPSSPRPRAGCRDVGGLP